METMRHKGFETNFAFLKKKKKKKPAQTSVFSQMKGIKIGLMFSIF